MEGCWEEDFETDYKAGLWFSSSLPSQIQMFWSSGTVSNSPERFLPRRPSTRSVVPKPSQVRRSNLMLKSMLLSVRRPTAHTTRPARARWARPLTRWQSLTPTHAFLVLRGSVWSTHLSCQALLAATWMLQLSCWQRKLLILSEVVLVLWIQRFQFTSRRHLTRRDEDRVRRRRKGRAAWSTQHTQAEGLSEEMTGNQIPAVCIHLHPSADIT